MSNTLFKLSQTVSASLSNNDIIEQLHLALNDFDKIYSYIIYAKHNNEEVSCWKIDYHISQVPKYNTLICNNIIPEITDKLYKSKSDTHTIVGYAQPPIELMLELYDPLVCKCAKEQCNRWKDLEYDDAVSMCRMVMLILANKGYYIHKQLLRKSFNMYVLKYLRKNINSPELVSLEKVMYCGGDEDDTLTLADMIADTSIEEKEQDKDNEIAVKAIFEEVKAIIIELVGERQFEQLLRDYGHKHTTTWSRSKMLQIKKRFKELGLNARSFNKYYE